MSELPRRANCRWCRLVVQGASGCIANGGSPPRLRWGHALGSARSPAERRGCGIPSEALGALALAGLIRAALPTCGTEGRVVASGASLTHCYVSHQCIPAARVFARAGMASGRRGDLVGLDLTSSATHTWTVIATSPSVCGHLDLARHRGWAPASPRNHQLDGIWVGVVSPPFHKRVWACDGSRRVFLAQVCWVWLFEALGARRPCSRGLAHWAGPMGSPACVSLKPRSFRCLRVWALAMDWLK